MTCIQFLCTNRWFKLEYWHPDYPCKEKNVGKCPVQGRSSFVRVRTVNISVQIRREDRWVV